MNNLVFIVSLFVVMHEVQLQRSPYAGSANRFRGQPINLALGISSVPSTSSSPIIPAIVPSTSASPVSQTRVSTVQQPEKTRTVEIQQLSIPSRISNDFFSNRNFDEHRNHHQFHGKRDFHNFNDYYDY